MERTLYSTGALYGWRAFVARLALLYVASYGLLYFSYKFLMPWGGTGDFRDYYGVYIKPLDLHVEASPFVLRQVSAVLTHLVWKAHIYYPEKIAFQEAGIDQHIFFAALFTNWVFLVLAAATAGAIAEEIADNRDWIMATLAGLLCLLSFHTQYVVISGDVEGPAWFLFALGMLAYLRRWSVALVLVLALAVLERETVLIAFVCLAGFDLLRNRMHAGFKALTFAWALVCFGTYWWLRKMTPGFDQQTHVSGWISALRAVHVNGNLLFQGWLTQNVIAIAVASFVATRGWRRERGGLLLMLVGTLFCLDLVGLAAGIGNNIGRIGGILTPGFAALAAVDLLDLARTQRVNDGVMRRPRG